jgi:hypothetical protein
VIPEDLVEVVAASLELQRYVFHVRYHSHPALMLQVLLVHEFITQLQLLVAEAIVGLR